MNLWVAMPRAVDDMVSLVDEPPCPGDPPVGRWTTDALPVDGDSAPQLGEPPSIHNPHHLLLPL